MPDKENLFNHIPGNNNSEEKINHNDIAKMESDEITEILADRPDLKRKFELFDRRECTPKYLFEIESLDNMSIESIREKINIVDRLKYGYGVTVNDFHTWESDLPKINLSEELERKLELFKGKSYGPKNLWDLELVDSMDGNEIVHRIRLAEKTEKGLQKYGIIDYSFLRFIDKLDKTTLTAENTEKLELIKGKPYDLKDTIFLETFFGMTNDEIKKCIELAAQLEKENIKVNFFDFNYVLPKINPNNNLKEEFEKIQKEYEKPQINK